MLQKNSIEKAARRDDNVDMRAIKYCVYKEPPHYVAQCLNVEVSSFGSTVDEAVANLKEAVELYFEGDPSAEYHQIDEVLVGESVVHG